MLCNVTAVRSIPESSINTTTCRHCGEQETLGHVLGYCRFGMLLRLQRHNQIRELIANALSDKNYEVYQEICGISEEGSTRKSDIIAIEKTRINAYIIDPTVRFESNIRNQADVVHEEKRKIYQPTTSFYKEVIGLLFGSRSTLFKRYINFRKQFNLPKSLDQDIVISIF